MSCAFGLPAASEEFDFDYFKSGDYEHAVYKKVLSENISKVLYPSDNIPRGGNCVLSRNIFFQRHPWPIL